MAMLECPGCKRIVDDTTKTCPGCKYNIKKYVKQMNKDAKKSGKSNAFGTIGLNSIYDAKPVAAMNVPKLDFVAKKEAAEQPMFESPSLNQPAVTPAVMPSEEPIFESPSLNQPMGQPAAAPIFESPSLNQPMGQPAAAPMFESPSLNGSIESPQSDAPTYAPNPLLGAPAHQFNNAPQQNAAVYAANPLLGAPQQSFQPSYGAPQQQSFQPIYGAPQQQSFQPSYGAPQQQSFQPSYGASQQSFQPSYGMSQQPATGPGAANPLLAGNPLLGPRTQ